MRSADVMKTWASTPRSTYRLQVTADFDLSAAAGVVDYLCDLGVSWVYLSPLLEAEPGSEHGYDIVDHSSTDPARGGRAGLDRFADVAHASGLGLLVDIVPNHVGVGVPAENRWWWDVLALGQASRYATAFDIDWAAGAGKVRIPVLGDEPSPELLVEGGELRYHEHRFPLAPRTDPAGSVADVLAAQHYDLIPWREADTQLNYRRFFAVNTLAGIRVELRSVFEDSHVEIARWVRAGLVDGLRVDHPDGLADPGGYLENLAGFTGAEYVLVEKILHGDEELPQDWATAGTTGYDALGDFDRVLIDPAGEAALDAIDRELRGGIGAAPWPELIHGTKRAVADSSLRAEVLRITRDLRVDDRALAAADGDALADVVAELLACFPVYRTYLPFGAEHLEAAALDASQRRPDLAELIRRVVGRLGDPADPAAIRFQQTSGMVMAKGVEDCAFYRYNRLGSLTEVGGDPSQFAISVPEFHRRQQRRLTAHPLTMTTLTTHDTKRSEDARARINVLSEVPERWANTLRRLRELAPLPDGPLAELMWQAAIGAWPITRERLHAYAEKAGREAGTSTSWSEPTAAFESVLHGMVDDAFDRPEVSAEIDGFVELVRAGGWSNSLSAKLLQLTAPGVPDVYQGTELWDASLVDPDNRRPVDWDRRRQLLADVEQVLPELDDTGAAKLLVTSSALRWRRDHPELFTEYSPLTATGPAATHLIACNRGGAITLATRLPFGLQRAGGWGATTIELGPDARRDVISRRDVPGGRVAVGAILDRYPVALLVPRSEVTR